MLKDPMDLFCVRQDVVNLGGPQFDLYHKTLSMFEMLPSRNLRKGPVPLVG